MEKRLSDKSLVFGTEHHQALLFERSHSGYFPH